MLKFTPTSLSALVRAVRVLKRSLAISVSTNSSQHERSLGNELNLTGISLDDIDEMMSDNDSSMGIHYPKSEVGRSNRFPNQGHNLVVVQPWSTYANFDEHTDPDLQLAECVSLGNTITNWQVIGKKIIFSRHLNKKQLFGEKGFEEFKDYIFSNEGVSAVFLGLEALSGLQLATLESQLKLPCYDRFTMVLNIFRYHAKTKEAKIQIALAELPYIRSHLREIHDSPDYSSSAESLKLLVGGLGEKFYHQRLSILKKRENKLRQLLVDLRKRRQTTLNSRASKKVPTVSVVGYTNSGKTSLIKYLTQDENLCPLDQLFATLDVTAHRGWLPSCKDVLFVDTVGFISRIPTLLIDAFSATLQDVAASQLIVHVVDVSHPDFRLQYSTVMDALRSLSISKKLLNTKVTVGNKIDRLHDEGKSKILKDCDVCVSVTAGTNMSYLVDIIDQGLTRNADLMEETFRVKTGGHRYQWLKKNSTIVDCKIDDSDPNYLICGVRISQMMLGRWRKAFPSEELD